MNWGLLRSQVYLTEVARDLVQAAEKAAAVEPELRITVEARNDQSRMLDQALGQSGPVQDNPESSADRELNVQLYALTQALGRSPDPERLDAQDAGPGAASGRA